MSTARPGVPAPGSLTAAAEQAAAAIGSGVTAPGLPATVDVAPADDQPSSLRVALLAMGLLAAAVLVVVGLLRVSSTPKSTDAEIDARRLGLPALVAAAADASEPLVLAGEPANDRLASFGSGSALLVFADPASAGGIDTEGTAVEMHRRLRDRDGLTVVLVVPAPPGAPDAGRVIAADLKSRGIGSDLVVLVDPAAEDGGPGRWRRTRFGLDDATAAVLLEDGVVAMRVVPPSPSDALSRSHVAPLVRRAMEGHPPGVPVNDGTPDDFDPPGDPAAKEGDTLPERGVPGGEVPIRPPGR